MTILNDDKDRKIAVALKYDENERDAPYVIAKGKGIIADNIINKGNDEGIKIIEDQLLAHSLIKLEIAQEIPEELYFAVAEILSFIYELDAEREDHGK
ncbi:flagellar biosynthesis protein [Proteiniborus sp. DW1]|nr:flagellar biosynthesis protein [Proteiniborus sp. DW1]